MHGLAGHQIDRTTEQFRKFVFEPVDRKAEPGIRACYVEQVDVALIGLLAPHDRPEDGQLRKPEPTTDLGDSGALNLSPTDRQEGV